MSEVDWSPLAPLVAAEAEAYHAYQRAARGDNHRGRVLPTEVGRTRRAWHASLRARDEQAATFKRYEDEPLFSVMHRYYHDTVVPKKKGRR